MKNKLLLIIIFISPLFSFKYDDPVITTDDLNLLTGNKWTGTLSYLDYSGNKEVSIAAEVIVLKTDDADAFIFVNEYPDEPKANNTDTIRIEENGKKFGNETVTERITEADGMIKIVTSEEGTDNEKHAFIKHTYIISSSRYTVRKEVRFEGESNFITRHTYVFARAD